MVWYLVIMSKRRCYINAFCNDHYHHSRGDPSMKSNICIHSNGLAIWHGFPDNTHIVVNNGRIDRVEVFHGISLSETVQLFYSN